MVTGIFGPLLSLFCLASAAPAPAPAAKPAALPVLTAAEKAAEKRITDDYVRAHVRFLASDLLGGRGPATPGDRLAQAYIAAQFEALGLRPGAPDGSWYQPFDIVSIEGNPKALLFANGSGKKLPLQYAEDFIAVAGAQRPQSKLENAEVVFVGYGIVAPEYQWDDYKGTDLKGKVLLMMNNDPEGPDALFAGKTRLWYGRWDYKYEIAAKVGAAGAIIIHTTPSAGYPWQVVQTSWAGEQFELPAEGGHRLEVKAWVTEDAARRLVALGGKELEALRASAERRDFRPVPLGVHVSTQFKNVVQKKRTANVLGLLPGSDAQRSKQVVLYTAHHDHLGTKPNAKPGEDAIYNGAVDNASGVAAMLAAARAMTSLPSAPARSVLFAAVAAEEQGLLGSEFLASHPPFPPGAMVANINIDGINVLGRTRDVTMIGMGKSSLDAWVVALAREQGRVVKPDQLSDRGFFYRSDQFNFAKLGVPAAYFGSGMDFIGRPAGWGKRQREAWEAQHYHQPSDELRNDWELSGALEDIRLYYRLGLALAKSGTLPAWNPGDEFEAPRKKALEALGAQKPAPPAKGQPH